MLLPQAVTDPVALGGGGWEVASPVWPRQQCGSCMEEITPGGQNVRAGTNRSVQGPERSLTSCVTLQATWSLCKGKR